MSPPDGRLEDLTRMQRRCDARCRPCMRAPVVANAAADDGHLTNLMTDVQALVLATLKEIRNALVDNACTAVELNPDQNIEQFPRADLEQMVEGTFIAIK